MNEKAVDETLEHAHRLLFGRLVGWLFRMTGDLQSAEDAVAAAFASALTSWRSNGIPDSPEAWLRTVARNHLNSSLRRDARTVTLAPEDFPERFDESQPSAPIDDCLALLFVCAHPAIDPRMHAPLMLQAVLGVDAARIASVYLVPATTMGQRLARAKAKIRDAGIRYRVPEPQEFSGRLGAVLQAVYGAYGLSDPIAALDDEDDARLRLEALLLARLLTELLPDEPETWGLSALLLHTESRRPGRVVDGRFVPLTEQNTSRWSAEIRSAADAALARAATLARPGRFQLEAAISAIHSARADTGVTDWASVIVLYEGLLQLAPSVGGTIGAAGALIETGQLDRSARLLGTLTAESVRTHQPYWVCRARLEYRSNRVQDARASAAIAIGLTSHPAVRSYLIDCLVPAIE